MRVALIAILVLGCAAQSLGQSGALQPQGHWAFRPVIRPEVAAVRADSFARGAIDRFIRAAHEGESLGWSGEATRGEWLRRVTQDLTGLPPTPAELAAFESDRRPDAYERAVDRLLSSPRYGERMATWWLDLARYADTHGHYVDSRREMWRYRDEVVAAFNRHLPFDQFTIEQLAGDLIPGATLSQRIASGFQRNHMINFEPGAIPEEYRQKYIADRVATFGTVWLGQTLDCARCHDHKYDPFTMRDFYALAAFFARVPEEGLDGRRGNAEPQMKAPLREQRARLDALRRDAGRLDSALSERQAASAADERAWEASLAESALRFDPPRDAIAHFLLDELDSQNRLKNAASGRAASIHGTATLVPGKFGQALLLDGETWFDAGETLAAKVKLEARDPLTLAAWVFPTTADTLTIVGNADHEHGRRGIELYVDEGRLTLALVDHWQDEAFDALVVATKNPLARSRWQHVTASYDGSGRAAGVQLYLAGELQEVEVVRDRLGTGTVASDKPLRVGSGGPERGFRGLLDDVHIYARALSPSDAATLAGASPLRAALAVPREQRTPAQAEIVREHFLTQIDTAYRKLLEQRQKVLAAQREVWDASPSVMVMADARGPRETFILERGDYASPGERVGADTPASLPPLPPGAARDRLTLARWLVDGRNPLPPRVMVNRLWQLHFGNGLVRTADDFGTRGTPPTHPELLDWLADEFVRSGWNIQHLQRLIVLSATYRQTSRASAHQRRRDPDNVYLSYFPRQRLPAEMIRDHALAVSGLLVDEVSGPPVFPYQPPGLWEEIAHTSNEFTAQRYVPSHGADLYRRSLYTFWKRTSPPPNLVAFDAGDREVCTVQRPQTNTPLQALVLWNDPTFVEAARVLAAQVWNVGSSDEQRWQSMSLRILGRRLGEREGHVVQGVLDRHRAHFRAHPGDAEKLLTVGQTPRETRIGPAEHAAWTLAAQMLLSLDEAITRN